MAINETGQVYFTFEEIEDKVARLDRHMNFLRKKSLKVDLDIIGAEVWGETMLRCMNRTNRISKAKTYVYDQMTKLLNESMVLALKGLVKR